MPVQVDMRDVAKLIKGLEKAQATQVRKAIRTAVAEVGKDATGRVVEEADTFSHRIGPATRMKMSFAARSAGAQIATDLKKVPWAHLYERGGKKTGGQYWKGPVFGSKSGGRSNVERIREQVKTRYEEVDKWSKRNTHKFFYDQVWAEKDELKNRLAEEVGKILETIVDR